MAISLDVVTRLDDRSARGAANDAQRYFDQASTQAGRNFDRNLSVGFDKGARSAQKSAATMERAFNQAATASGRVRVEQEKYNALIDKGVRDQVKLVQQTERLSAAKRTEAQAVRQASTAHRDYEASMRSLTNSANDAGDSFRSTTSAMSALGGAIRSPAALAALVPVMLQATSAAVTLSGSLLVLPGVIGGVAAGFATMAIATSGFSEAIENMNDPQAFAESLRSLSPAAQQVALDIRALMPELTNFKNATQDALFTGAGEQLTRMSAALLPQIQQMTTAVASSFNQMFMGATNTLINNPQVGQIANNVSTAFQNLAPAAASLTQALTSLVAVGSTFLPDMAQGAAQAASAFSDMIQEGARTGDLQAAIRDGITVLGMLADAAVEAGKMFGALATDGVAAMSELRMQVETVSTVIRIATGDTEAWGNVFPSIGSIAAQAFAEVGNSIDTYVLGPLRFAIDLINKIPGMDIGNIPDFQFTNEGVIARSNSPIPGTNTPGFAGQPVLGGGANASRERRGVPPVPASGQRDLPSGLQGAWWPEFGMNGQRGGGFYTQGQQGYVAGTAPERGRGGGAAAGPEMPSVPYAGDPMELLQGVPVTAELYGKAGSVIDAKQRMAQAEAELNALLQSNTATAAQIQDKRNDVARADREAYEAELRLNEAKQSSTEAFTASMQDASGAMGEIGVALDKDLGISKGLAGMADNLVRFLGSLALAPALGALQGSQMAAGFQPGSAGKGIFGMMAGSGAFGSQFLMTPGMMGQAGGGYGGYGSYGGYPGDAALLANVPSGRYTQEERGDLTQGLADCSSAVEDLVNLMDGRPTEGASMSTGNAAEWLQARGFLPGSMPGAFNVGFNGGHMQATLPGGTPFNWGSQAAAARGGVGGTGAFDPSFTSNYYRPVGSGGVSPSALGPSPLGGGRGAPLVPPAPGWGGPTGVPSSLTGGRGESPIFGPRGPGLGAAAGAAGAPNSALKTQAYANPVGGDGFAGIGGLPMAAIQAGIGAAGGAGSMFGGQAGAAAAQMMTELANRAIAFGGQAASIGVSGLFETFMPSGESAESSISNSWLGRIVGGLAGAAPALPNLAGQAAPPEKKPEGQQQGQPGQVGPNGEQVGVKIENYNVTKGEDRAGQDLARHQGAAATAGKMPWGGGQS